MGLNKNWLKVFVVSAFFVVMLVMAVAQTSITNELVSSSSGSFSELNATHFNATNITVLGYIIGNPYFLDINVSGQEVCLENGTNCPAGTSADVTAVYTTGDFLSGGAASGDITLAFDAGLMNTTIDAREYTNTTAEIQAVSVGGEVSGTVGNMVVSNTALDDQYVQLNTITAADVAAGTFPSGNYVFTDNVSIGTNYVFGTDVGGLHIMGYTSKRIYYGEESALQHRFFTGGNMQLQIEDDLLDAQDNDINTTGSVHASYLYGDGSGLTGVAGGGNSTSDIERAVTSTGLNWTALKNYPAACPSGTFVGTVADSITCNAPSAADVDAGTFPSGNYSFASATTNHVIVPSNNDAASPSLCFGTDCNDGFYQGTNNADLILVLNGGAEYIFHTGYIDSNVGTGWKLMDETMSATNPGYAIRGDENTGIGTAGGDTISLIAGASEIVRVSSAGIDVNGNVLSDDWSNVTITESQITDLSHTTDTYNTTAEIQAVSVGGEVSGTVGSLTVSDSALDDAYVELGDSFGGEVSGTYDSLTLSNAALDDQYLEQDAANTAGGNLNISDFKLLFGAGGCIFQNSSDYIVFSANRSDCT